MAFAVRPALYERQSTATRFVLGTSRKMIEDLLRVVGQRGIRSIVDVAVYKGGSVVLFHRIFGPRRLVAIDFNPARVQPLET